MAYEEAVESCTKELRDIYSRYPSQLSRIDEMQRCINELMILTDKYRQTDGHNHKSAYERAIEIIHRERHTERHTES